ncbi:peptidoglycan/xylan/chitin deacetylase (PgdA/CDA1 family) [Saccharopolyspora lacisalsi]|uniref:Peptidoglycan/xylan/chitin deacetylase (PgdA/CDA1 family) n=1 Tax=Halosaccharopolyspora lacisalsi TaxID=1000566 RepID=A0A839E079_9PSEU|nr:polysaccharide deacetylase family protein [Halosaccharopolyspora lacisalsi]MBA8824378.1 peptidoglycan/xylan/chitin deacetylase (PgdA/CDA1 family) [Halosaccharopolyspora lacisalsi]
MLEQFTRRTRRTVRDGALPYILMYHSVASPAWDPYLVTVSPKRLERQLRWLRRRGLRGTSIRELLYAWERGRSRGLVGLTFDDGYADFAETVAPALVRHGCTATVFVLAGRLGGSNEWDAGGPRKELMTARQVRQVAEAGMEVGSHGMWHRPLCALSSVELHEEVEHSRSVLERVTDREVEGFCYPYGEANTAVVEAVRSGGYDYGCAIWWSELRGRHALPRTYVGDNDHSWRLLAKHFRHDLRSRVVRST